MMFKSPLLKYSGLTIVVVGILVFLSTSLDIFVTSTIKPETEPTTPLMRCPINRKHSELLIVFNYNSIAIGI
jgi:hypothetical protein